MSEQSGNIVAQLKKRGRPKFEPTDEQRATVQEMYGLRVPEDKIATSIGIAVETLRRRFRAEKRMGPAMTDATLAQSLYTKATGSGPGAASVAMYLAQVWLGYRPPATPIEITGKNGGPVETKHEIAVRFIDPPQWPPDPPIEETDKKS